MELKINQKLSMKQQQMPYMSILLIRQDFVYCVVIYCPKLLIFCILSQEDLKPLNFNSFTRITRGYK